MNYCEYMESISGVPVSGMLQYEPAFIWVNSYRLPVRLCSLGNEKMPVVKVPSAIDSGRGHIVPVISFSRETFKEKAFITDIVLPSTIENIPAEAFAGCVNLRNITIPKKVTIIKKGTFAGCTNLQNVYYDGTFEDWKKINIVHYLHEVEFGDLVPGTPVQRALSERIEIIPGNEALFTANIYLKCELEKHDKLCSFSITEKGKDVTPFFIQNC